MATITIYPKTDKVSKKTGKTPMYVRILHQNKKAEASLKIEVTEQEFERWNFTMQSFDPSRDPLNSRINRVKGDYENFLAMNKVHLEFTAREILDHILGIEAKEEAYKPLVVVDFIDNYLREHIDGSSLIKSGTKRNYRKSILHFKKFLKENDYGNLELKNFKFPNAERFNVYLSNVYYPNKKTKMLPVSVSSVVIKIKAIFEYAVKAEFIPRNPFKGIKIVTESIEKKPQLSAADVALIYKKDLSSYPTLEVYRDMFLFGCFTGFAYVDIFNLKWANISVDDLGTKLNAQRVKTNVEIEQYLITYAVDIINKYKNSLVASLNGTIFPPRSLTHLNIGIKGLADICGITKKVSSHIARHTCSGFMSQAEIPTDIVAGRIMGWETGKNISWVYQTVTNSSLIIARNKFQLYLDKYLIDGFLCSNSSKA